jgi:hypothetical protein
VTQLKSALEKAGYRSSHEIRAERDRAIAALVKARRSKRKGANVKSLKARVLALVEALRTATPIAIVLLVVLGMSGIALAHPGHDGHGGGLDPSGAIVVVGVTLGLAAHAWSTWGPRRRALATVDGGGDMGGGSSEPEPNAYCVKCGVKVKPDGKAECPLCGFDTVVRTTPEPDNTELEPYYTVSIPYVAPEYQTKWHPTEATGTLTRGNFPTFGEACTWANAKLGGTSYSVDYVDNDRIETVYTFNSKPSTEDK